MWQSERPWRTANKYLEAHGKQMKDASKKTNTSRSQNSSSGNLPVLTVTEWDM